MANHPSAEKRAVRNKQRAEINGARMSRVKTFIKKIEQAVQSGNKKEATEALKKAQPEIARAAAKGLIKKNTASRKMSRLTARVKAIK